MISNFLLLIGDDIVLFRRYVVMAFAAGLLNAASTVLIVPVLQFSLMGETVKALGWAAALVICALVCWLWRRRVEIAGIGVGLAVLRGGRLRFGDHVARLPIGWFDTGSMGRLHHALTHGIMEVAQLPAHVFTPVLSGLVVPPVLALVLLALDWKIGLVAIVALPVLAAIFVRAARLGRVADQEYHAAAVETGQRAVEFARSQSVLRAFSGEGTSTRFLQEAFSQHRSASLKMIRTSTISVVLNSWVMNLIFAVILLLATLSFAGEIQSDQAVALVLALVLAQRFLEPITELAGYGDALRSARHQIDALGDILKTQPMPMPEHPQSPQDGSVTLDNVSFRYAADMPDVLQNISLTVPAGSMTALVGASGSGKSTVARLVARFFDVDHGTVCIGGVDVRNMAEAVLTQQVSLIFQDSYLLQGTIEDNIRLGWPDASQHALDEVILRAGLTSVLSRLPNGLQSEVGEGGLRLSGGERQRIAIARALLKDAPVLLVDEATAALDPENQAIISETLAHLRGKRTIIVIAHQLSTIAMADEIAVIDGGKVVERGSPDALAAQNGAYAEFLACQHVARGWRIGACAKIAE